ncbi:MAG: hypothetical protein HYU63_04135 [Armatimonadetes bacterium]|nr:hypothetical protein [Armatimonadota bacterium]
MKKINGYILLLTLTFIMALIFFSILYLELYRSGKVIIESAENDIIAESAANAGINDALYQLRQNRLWQSGFSDTSLSNSQATYSLSFDNTQTLIPYSTNNLSNSNSASGYNGRSVPPYSAHLISVGKYRNSSRIEETLAFNLFKFAAFGITSIRFRSNSLTDSYDTSLGSYGATQQNSQGNIGTNSVSSGAVRLDSGCVINGSLTVGPGGTSSVKTGSGTYQSLVVASRIFPVTPLSAPSGTSQGNVTINGTQTLLPGIYNNLTVNSGATVRLQTGTYVFNRITLQNTSALTLLSAPVSVYFGNQMLIRNGVNVNTSGNPGDLSIFGTSKVLLEFIMTGI